MSRLFVPVLQVWANPRFWEKKGWKKNSLADVDPRIFFFTFTPVIFVGFWCQLV